MFRLSAILLLIAVAQAGAQPYPRGPRPGGREMGGPPGPGRMPPPFVMERLSRMSPEEREGILKRLPADRRALLEDRLRDYDQLPKEAKDRLRREYNGFRQLPPEKQEEVRKMFHKFAELPPDRRHALRRELNALRDMPEDKRSAVMSSDRFRSEYSDEERDLLQHLSGALPAPAPPASAEVH